MILRQSALAKIVISYHPLKGQIYSKRKAIKRQQRKRPLFSRLDRENSVHKGFFFYMTETRNSVLRIQRGKSRGAKSSPSCSLRKPNKTQDSLHFSCSHKRNIINHFCDIKY